MGDVQIHSNTTCSTYIQFTQIVGKKNYLVYEQKDKMFRRTVIRNFAWSLQQDRQRTI